VIGSALLGLALPPASAAAWWCVYRLVGGRYSYVGGWITSGLGVLAVSLIGRHWLTAAFAAASLLVALAVWWWKRKDRKRAASLVGAKSRALRDALVRRAREVARPRPVLKPAPGGVGH
jgi:uncharacterized membrane protein YfcA